MIYAVAGFRRRVLSVAPLAAVAASALPRGGTLAFFAACTLVSLSRSRCRYPYQRRRGRLCRVLLSYLTFACVFLALTALLPPLMPPLPLRSGAAVFGVCASADAARARLSPGRTRALCGALAALGAALYAR